MQDSEKSDQIQLLILNKCVSIIKENLNTFKQTVLEELTTQLINEGGKKSEIIKKNYLDEFLEIEKIISSELNKILHTLTVKCLNNAMVHINIDTFFSNYFTIKNVLNLNNLQVEFNYIFLKFQNEYIFHYFEKKEKKIKDSVECEDWQAFQNIPGSFQKLADVITKFSLDDVRINNEGEIIKYFSENEHGQNGDQIITNINVNSTQINDSSITNNNNTTIEINKINFKLMPTTLEVIKIAYDSLKMLSLFDYSMFQTIINNLINLFTNFANFNKEIILDGNGHIQSLSQNEISITCANLSIVKNIIQSLMQNDTNNLIGKYSNSIANILFKDLLVLLDNLIHTCKCRISDLIDRLCISRALGELNQIKLPNYPIVEGEALVNPYALTLCKFFRAIYDSMINAFDNSYIVSTSNENLKKFFEKFEKFLQAGPKIENENSLKQ
jgi:hypothetical protein